MPLQSAMLLNAVHSHRREAGALGSMLNSAGQHAQATQLERLVIAADAFSASEYPLILSLENHLSLKQQVERPQETSSIF